MKKNILWLAILLVAIKGFSQPEAPENLLQELITENKVVGIAAGYSVNGKTLWQVTSGYANKATRRSFEADTKVRMASIAKPMTALAVMQLVEQGLIDLNAPIQTYLPDYPKQLNTQITTKHLLSHTSGIAGYKNPKEAETKINYPSLSEAVNLFKDRPLLFEPGTEYSYTTYGYTLLGLILEKVTGVQFEAYMQQHIWDAAGMNNTGVAKFGVNQANASNLYRRSRNGKIKEGEENNLSNRIPGGGFYTTVEDMLKFGNAVINNTYVSPETLTTMRQHHSLEKENNAYGLGWFLYNPKPNEGAIIGHSGAQTGCSSQLFIVPEKEIVAIVLANTSRAPKETTNLAVELLKIALNQEE